MRLEEKFMRPLVLTALFGSFLSVASLQAQSLAEHAAAASGATIGTAAGKPMSTAINKIFGQADEQTKAASRTAVNKTAPHAHTIPAADQPSAAGPSGTAAPGPGPAPLGASGSSSGATGNSTEFSSTRRHVSARHVRQPETSTAEAAFTPAPSPVVVEPPAPKEPTAEQVAGIQLGLSEKDVIAALGVPASRVIIPDDDGHLRETFQFWAKGSQVGTVRLDNGYVVKVDARRF
jgi:hypothetical protein